MMTPEQHESISRGLKQKITRRKNKAKAACGMLAKLRLLDEAKELEEQLRQHRLAFYTLTHTQEQQ